MKPTNLLLPFNFVKIISFILLTLFLQFCTKEDFPCESNNCGNLWISGKVVDTSNNKGLANIPVTVYWRNTGMGFWYVETKAGAGKTDANGNFNFKVRIDTANFGGYALCVAVPLPEGFIVYNSLNHSSSQHDPSFFQNIRFIVGRKANLTIKLNRTSLSPFLSFHLGYRFGYTLNLIYYTNGNSALNAFDFKVSTIANLYTYVHSQKTVAIGQHNDFKDSIRCTANSENVIHVNY